jgi:hypothetical protein
LPPLSSTGRRGCGPLPCCGTSALPSRRHLCATLAFEGARLPLASMEGFRPPGSILRPH